MDEIKKLIAEYHSIRVEDINDDSNLYEDLGMDSLDLVEFTMEVEMKYELDISDEEVENLHTVNDWVEYVDSEMS